MNHVARVCATPGKRQGRRLLAYLKRVTLQVLTEGHEQADWHDRHYNVAVCRLVRQTTSDREDFDIFFVRADVSAMSYTLERARDVLRNTAHVHVESTRIEVQSAVEKDHEVCGGN